MILNNTPYTVGDLWWIMYKAFYFEKPLGNHRRLFYYNKACAFDIEVTSTVINNTKAAFMYVWMFGIDGYCIVGRTWEEFRYCIERLCTFLGLGEKVLLPVYVHNLSYEMQFIKDMFKWKNILALSERKPITCRACNGIEFRCSYRLSGYSLEKLGEQLRKYKVEKKVGDLNYDLIRHSTTPLTETELGYCVNDVLVVMAYIQECIELEGSINDIPTTKTGYVRRYAKRACLGTSKHRNYRYRNMIRNLTLEPDEYLQLRRCFQGGFTHASALHSTHTMRNVVSYDFTSSYPTVMLCEQFPMSSSRIVNVKDKEEFEYYIANYCCMWDATFSNIHSKEMWEHYISQSHCYRLSKDVLNDNGRVVKAELLSTTITEQDFMIIRRMYSWDSMEIENFRIYKKGYLPTEFIESIVKLYEDKTQLKDVEGKEVEYMQAKANLNSLYGMTVTDIIRDDIYYDGEWITEEPNLNEALKRYNSAQSRFLFYPWGVWVTAYARVNLWTGIIEAKEDYVYSDTDSLKMINAEKHFDYIQRYNDMIDRKIEQAMKHHKIPINRTKPKTIDGIEKPIGRWDYEGEYVRFKTLGAKRYLWENAQGKQQITIAGLGKKVALKYMQKQDRDIFEFFNPDMYIPKGHAGKMIHTYIDVSSHGAIYDYLGNKGEFNELSSLYMEPADYSLSLGVQYAEFLFMVGELDAG